jgi:hypothetical protein
MVIQGLTVPGLRMLATGLAVVLMALVPLSGDAMGFATPFMLGGHEPTDAGAAETDLPERASWTRVEHDASDPLAKIAFDLAAIDEMGLTGPPDGLVAVGYEFCIPATPVHLDEVHRIDPSVQTQPGAPGRIGCGAGQVLAIGSTQQSHWRSVLLDLAALDYVTRIERFFAE